MIAALELVRGPHGSNLYETLFFGLKAKFQYPPSSLLIIDLLSAFVSLSPFFLNCLSSVAFLGSIIGMVLLLQKIELCDVAGGRRQSPIGGSLATIAMVVFAALCTFYPLLHAISLGQIQVWIDFLFIWGCLSFVIDRHFLAGTLVGLACTMKPQLGVFLVWALVWREHRFGLGFLLTYIPFTIGAVLRYGVQNSFAYLDVLSFISKRGESVYMNQSVNGLMNRLLGNGNNLTWDAHVFAPPNHWVHSATIVAAAVFTMIPLGVAFRARRRADPWDLGLAALCFTMASPIAWEHHYGIAIPIYVLALRAVLKHPPSLSRRTRIWALAVSWCLTANYMPWLNASATTRFNVLQSYVFWGALILLGILLIETVQMTCQSLGEDVVER
ncbi:glycosyltransferase family 87 protein [Acidisphaera sp. S103]|uniref:glycosyltransferase family 87 protein n=1 Tax=Acidisphaera sp. S103 TaxID=1747223 RepID=UPI00131A8C7E|nr:glycosyltransferase family 87 protein [Acidisphaera sp. S103]